MLRLLAKILPLLFLPSRFILLYFAGILFNYQELCIVSSESQQLQQLGGVSLSHRIIQSIYKFTKKISKDFHYSFLYL